MGSTSSLLVHTIIFILSFVVVLLGAPWEAVLLVVTTAVSLEAIYMNILIQMGVNENTRSLQVVEVDVDEIQKDVDEIQRDVDEIQEDVDEIQEDVDEIGKDIDEIQEDVSETEKEEAEDEQRETRNSIVLSKIETQLQAIIQEIEKIKGRE